MKNFIDDLLKLSSKTKKINASDKKNFQKFLAEFYAENKPEDFASYPLQDIYNISESSFDFFKKKDSKGAKIQIFNPTLKKDGFNLKFTIINILVDDSPFLVDSVVLYLDSKGIKIKNVLHPNYFTARDKKGELEKIVDEVKGASSEAMIQIHVQKIESAAEIKEIHDSIAKSLESVALVVKDWKGMAQLAVKAASQTDLAKKINKSEITEIKDFVNWINDGHFIFLGAQEFDIKKNAQNKYSLAAKNGAALGVFASPYEEFIPQVKNLAVEEVANSVKNPYVIEILKSRYRSRIHRFISAERIRIQKFSTQGEVIGEFRFIGLFTSSVYYSSTREIPVLRSKVEDVIEKSGYAKGSHNYKDLVSILETYPREELFQISNEELLKNATGIVAICGRAQTKLFVRKDKFSRFVSCLVFIPKEVSDSNLRNKIEAYLSKSYQGILADSFVQMNDSNLVRLHIIIRTENSIPNVNEAEVEKEIIRISRAWSDDLQDSMRVRFGEDNYLKLSEKYRGAFSVSYINRFDARRGAIDISYLEKAVEQQKAVFNLYKSSWVEDDVAELKVYSPSQEISLSQMMPILESFGFNVIQEHNYQINVDGKNKVWIHYFRLNLSENKTPFSEKIRINFEKTISLIWEGKARSGLLNRLVVAADLNWKQVYMLRCYSKYLHQTGFRYSQSYTSDVMVKNHKLAKLLVDLFEAKFDPEFEKRDAAIAQILEQIKQSLSEVSDSVEDAVIRAFFNVINATLRTNYYQSNADGKFKDYMSFKFDCTKIPGLPLPLPYAEIFVCSPKVEAVHLRGGKVARGGLRWSDRHEDFRTEVLGLVKAQMTKNAVIVPVGSKGGFVVKKPTKGMSREEIQKEGIQCYKTFLRGLLDITDNVVNGKIQHPKDVVMHDGVDPYLVVAADKGTATFSDIANSVSAEYNFWLGDAFASGGSVGYDHKKMGITAKGGWISVMRHFREMGIDTQSQDFTCVGIGDLAGDVFGNGMLLSKHIRLVAAFNHMHIFFDPNPNAAKSFAERERMFNLPRSSWSDYDKSLISKGGGIFERSAKSIKISAEIKAILQISEDELAPNDLIQAILKAPVDLLWNGGIGTYVKSTEESHLDVGDRANDSLRINGNELRCKVIGEGGNLGWTQKGRIEYALNKGRVNTDAMDNSAGVDCSDHEVNIKIALTQALRAKKITLEQRNKILEQMTDNVSHLVLEDNRLQTQAISIAQYQGISALGDQAQFLDNLEKSGLLNRKVEFLPSKKEIEKRQVDKVSLTRPELCVMLAYAKMDIYNKILASNLVKDEYFETHLFSYFPKLMQEKFAAEIENHQLRKEIIATQITNFVVNRMGITFLRQICQDSGFDVVDVVKSFIIAADAFSIEKIWSEAESLDGKSNFEVQMKMFLSPNKLLERSVVWLLRNQTSGKISQTITRFKKIADELFGLFPEVLAQASRESFEKKVNYYLENKVDKKLATRLASMDPASSTFDIAEICAISKFDLKSIAKIYFTVGTRFSLKWMRSRIADLNFENHWQRMSAKTILEDVYFYQMKIAKAIVDFSCNDKKICEINSVNAWVEKYKFNVERFDGFVTELKSQTNPDLAVFVVALNRLKSLVN